MCVTGMNQAAVAPLANEKQSSTRFLPNGTPPAPRQITHKCVRRKPAVCVQLMVFDERSAFMLKRPVTHSAAALGF